MFLVLTTSFPWHPGLCWLWPEQLRGPSNDLICVQPPGSRGQWALHRRPGSLLLPGGQSLVASFPESEWRLDTEFFLPEPRVQEVFIKYPDHISGHLISQLLISKILYISSKLYDRYLLHAQLLCV